MKFALWRWLEFLVFLLLCTALVGLDRAHAIALQPAGFASGWTLLSVIALLTVYRARKRVPFLALGRTAHWLRLHLYAGFLGLLLFALHVRWRWPHGILENVLASLYLTTTASGIIGFFLTQTLPAKLTRRGENVLFERIPSLRQKVRTQAEAVVERASSETGSSTLADFYAERAAWFMEQPRHLWQHLLGSSRARHALLLDFATVERYLSTREKEWLTELRELVCLKDDLDYQTAGQWAIKYWLFAHVPLAYSLLVVAAVHLLLVYAFIGGL